jgi:hypothetical protein
MTATDATGATGAPDASRVTVTTCDPETLRTLFLFEKLTDEQLQRLCAEGHVEIFQPGQVFREGEARRNAEFRRCPFLASRKPA